MFAEIKSRLLMREVVERYGFEVNRAGFILCPFHREKTPSLKVYESGFNCFGCGVSGDAVRFIALLHNIGDYEAAKQLDCDFGLGSFTADSLTKNCVSRLSTARDVVSSFETWIDGAYRAITDLNRATPPRPPQVSGLRAAKFLALQSMSDYLFTELFSARTKAQQLQFYKNYHKTIGKIQEVIYDKFINTN
jgi:hypothetical protein